MNWVEIVFLVFLLIILILIIVLIVLVFTASPPEALDSQVFLPTVTTQRISGLTTVSLTLKYRYSSFTETKFPNQTELIDDATEFINGNQGPSLDTPIETVMKDMTRDLYSTYNVDGISTMVSFTDPTTSNDENFIFTKGSIAPLPN